MADAIGYTIVVVIPVGLIVAYLFGWIEYDDRGDGGPPGTFGPPPGFG